MARHAPHRPLRGAGRRPHLSRGDARYYRGYAGYRFYRPGYRHFGGWWFPAAALTGALIAGAIEDAPVYAGPPTYAGNAHVDWCYGHYRSYRAPDNSWQPLNGPRRACVSPYDY